MLKADILKASTILAGLTDEQVTAIEELSKNDEDAVISRKIGEIYGNIDRDIEESTGLKKPENTKTYEWMKNDILPQVKNVKDIEAKLTTSKTKMQEMQAKIDEGAGDELLKTSLEDQKQLVADLRSEVTTLKENHLNEISTVKADNFNMRVENDFEKALSGLKFKDEAIISKGLRENHIANQKAEILKTYKPDFVENRLVFRDEKGEIIRNKDDSLNPTTAKDLLLSKIGDVLDAGKDQAGAGTGGKKDGNGDGKGKTMDLSTAKTQVDADNMITQRLMDDGVARGTQAFTDQFKAVRDENKIKDLPIR